MIAERITDHDYHPLPHTCVDCGEYFVGDGYTLVYHCPLADISDGFEPDADPVSCGWEWAFASLARPSWHFAITGAISGLFSRLYRRAISALSLD